MIKLSKIKKTDGDKEIFGFSIEWNFSWLSRFLKNEKEEISVDIRIPLN